MLSRTSYGPLLVPNYNGECHSPGLAIAMMKPVPQTVELRVFAEGELEGGVREGNNVELALVQ